MIKRTIELIPTGINKEHYTRGTEKLYVFGILVYTRQVTTKLNNR